MGSGRSSIVGRERSGLLVAAVVAPLLICPPAARADGDPPGPVLGPAPTASATPVSRRPSVLGTARVGSPVRARNGHVADGVSTSYQWYRRGSHGNAVLLDGATRYWYRPTGRDRSHRVWVAVTYTSDDTLPTTVRTVGVRVR